ncbi:MAG: signal peptidase I [Eubacteriales bacterium]
MNEVNDEQQFSSRVKEKRIKKKRDRIGFMITILIAAVLALSIRFFVFEFIVVNMTSMQPTLEPESVMCVEKVSYMLGEPGRGDIVIFDYAGEDKDLVKRVIGIEGDTIEILEGHLYINGQLKEESYIKEPMSSDTTYGPFVVPEDKVFVMGDNRNVSKDSRDPSVGAVDLDTIIGRCFFVIWPIDQISSVS